MEKKAITIDGIVDKKTFSPRPVTLVVRETKIPTSVIDLELAVAGNDGQRYKVCFQTIVDSLAG